MYPLDILRGTALIPLSCLIYAYCTSAISLLPCTGTGTTIPNSFEMLSHISDDNCPPQISRLHLPFLIYKIDKVTKVSVCDCPFESIGPLAEDLAGQTQRRWRQERPLTPIAC